MFGVVVPRGTEFDVLRSFVMKENFLQPLVEFFGKGRKIFGGIERRLSQFLWVWFNKRYSELTISKLT